MIQLTRRQMLQTTGLTALAALAYSAAPTAVSACINGPANTRSCGNAASFTAVPPGKSDQLRVAAEYTAELLIAWGDPINAVPVNWLVEPPPFDPTRMNAATAAQRFGQNNDYTAFFPFPDDTNRALLWVNHEFTIPQLMFSKPANTGQLMREQIATELESVGGSVLELTRTAKDAPWQLAASDRYSRRITASTPCTISGPAAGHTWLRTNADPSGMKALGTLANCAGGTTPWNHVLTAEENINEHFYHDDPTPLMRRYDMGDRGRGRWWYGEERFDLRKHPNEANRFGWIVEIDPFDPASTPVKRTALGRFKHECATTTQLPDGRIVIYMGDDEGNQHLYRFISRDAYKAGSKAGDLLDHGTLYVAKLYADGSGEWRALTHGNAKLTPQDGWPSQAEICIDTRGAANALDASPLDRPEDIAIIHHAGKPRVMISLTKNYSIVPPNFTGSVMALDPANGDHAAKNFSWREAVTGKVGSGEHFATPDNLAVDPQGRLWLSTDGMEYTTKSNDSVFLLTPEGDAKCILRCPYGAEATGMSFAPDGRSMFVSIQHPSEGTTLSNPRTRWPDHDETKPPRPGIVQIRRRDGGVI